MFEQNNLGYEKHVTNFTTVKWYENEKNTLLSSSETLTTD